MTKYHVGDSFIVTITSIDEQGLGVAYTLNESLIAAEMQLDQMERLDVTEMLKEKGIEVKKTESKEYTPEDLLFRIEKMSKILGEMIERYSTIRKQLDVGCPNIDKQIEELSL